MKDKTESQVPPDYYLEFSDEAGLLMGNTKGLEKLKEAIDEAVNNGDAQLELGDFKCINCLEDNFFINKPEEPESKLNNFIVFSILLSVLLVFIVGIISIVRFLL